MKFEEIIKIVEKINTLPVKTQKKMTIGFSLTTAEFDHTIKSFEDFINSNTNTQEDVQINKKSHKGDRTVFLCINNFRIVLREEQSFNFNFSKN